VITLRRVAHGQSDGARPPAQDLARLRRLMLINGDARWPQLTAAGRQRFDALAKPAARASLDIEGTLAAVVERLRVRGRRR
jgi:hypothetical protein